MGGGLVGCTLPNRMHGGRWAFQGPYCLISITSRQPSVPGPGSKTSPFSFFDLNLDSRNKSEQSNKRQQGLRRLSVVIQKVFRFFDFFFSVSCHGHETFCQRCVSPGVWAKSKTKLCGCGCYWLKENTRHNFLWYGSTGLQTCSSAISQMFIWTNDLTITWFSEKRNVWTSLIIYPISNYFSWVWGSSAPLQWMIKYAWTDDVSVWKADFP